MHHRSLSGVTLACLALTTGCSNATVDGPAPQTDAGTSPQAGAGTSPATVPSLSATLTPENSSISLLLEAPGNAAFADFFGAVHFGPDGRSPSGLVLELQTASLQSGVDVDPEKLMSPEGLNAAQFPFAEFRATAVRAKTHGLGGTAEITGGLTLAGTTSQITFPAEYSLRDDDAFTLNSELRVRSAEFGLPSDGPLGKEFTLLIVVREAPIAAGQ